MKKLLLLSAIGLAMLLLGVFGGQAMALSETLLILLRRWEAGCRCTPGAAILSLAYD